MVGLISDEKHITRQFFRDAGDAIILIGDLVAGVSDPGHSNRSPLGASHYLKIVHGRKEGLPPRLDFGRELAVHDAVRALIRCGLVKSAHDCSEGGLAVALAECCISGENRWAPPWILARLSFAAMNCSSTNRNLAW